MGCGGGLAIALAVITIPRRPAPAADAGVVTRFELDRA